MNLQPHRIGVLIGESRTPLTGVAGFFVFRRLSVEQHVCSTNQQNPPFNEPNLFPVACRLSLRGADD